MQTVWIAYLLVAAAAFALFFTAGWHGRQPADTQPDIPVLPPEAFRLRARGVGAPNQALGDAAEAINIALKRLMPLIDRQFVRVEVAARHGLIVRMAAPALADLVEEVLAAAIQNAPTSTVLVVAAPQGDHINITIADDIPGVNAAVRQGQIRGVRESVAMLGASLDLRVLPEEGTVMILRLAAAFETPEDLPQKPLTEAEPEKVRQLL